MRGFELGCPMTDSKSPRSGMTKRLLGFAGLPFLSMATPFLFFPILARIAGADAWLAIAIGQSVGTFFALVVAQGYNMVGPTAVSLAAAEHRADVFRRSFQSRVSVFIPSAVAAAIIAWLVSPEGNRGLGALMSVAMTMVGGLSSAWYMIGLGKASLIALYEILPKVFATAAAAILVVAYSQVFWYPIFLIVGSLGSLAVFSAKTVKVRDLVRFSPSEIITTLRANRSAMATEIAGGSYVALTVTFVGASAVASQAAAYVSGDKLYKLGQYAVAAVGNALQGWVVENGRSEFAQRARNSFVAHAALGVVGMVIFTLFGPMLSALLFGNVVAIDFATAFGFGVATLAISLNTSVGRHSLVGMGARKEVMVSVFIGAGVGVPAILLLSAQFGAAGGAWGLAMSEMTVLLVQLVFVYRLRAIFSRTADELLG
jgi:O-antigen/teichoic acid export membrane protein